MKLVCINCKNKKKLIKKPFFFKCSKCNYYYPTYNGIPVILNDCNDFYHLRKSLLPAKYRINKYED